MESELGQPARMRRSLELGEWFKRAISRRSASNAGEPIANEPAPQPAPAAASNGTSGLSPRELDVLRLLPRGMTNQQIARELVVSEPTVATHVRHILQKTGAANRAEAAAYAVRNSLD